MNQGFIPIGQFEAASNGGTDWTQAFAQAFAEAAQRGGGTVYVPAGTYPTRSIELLSNTTRLCGCGRCHQLYR